MGRHQIKMCTAPVLGQCDVIRGRCELREVIVVSHDMLGRNGPGLEWYLELTDVAKRGVPISTNTLARVSAVSSASRMSGL